MCGMAGSEFSILNITFIFHWWMSICNCRWNFASRWGGPLTWRSCPSTAWGFPWAVAARTRPLALPLSAGSTAAPRHKPLPPKRLAAFKTWGAHSKYVFPCHPQTSSEEPPKSHPLASQQLPWLPGRQFEHPSQQHYPSFSGDIFELYQS